MYTLAHTHTCTYFINKQYNSYNKKIKRHNKLCFLHVWESQNMGQRHLDHNFSLTWFYMWISRVHGPRFGLDYNMIMMDGGMDRWTTQYFCMWWLCLLITPASTLFLYLSGEAHQYFIVEKLVSNPKWPGSLSCISISVTKKALYSSKSTCSFFLPLKSSYLKQQETKEN